VWAGFILTVIKNRWRNRSFQESYAQADHQDIVQLTDDRNEIGDELDRTGDIKHCAPTNQLCIQGHPRVNKSPREGANLFIQLAGSSPQSCG
jgi:hypothetical protein